MAIIKFDKINKLYESGVHAISDVSFDVIDNEFTVLVGPSGCGKSTLLRMLAGLEEITTGIISIDGKIINEVPAKDRNISMVFQNYALYPHLTVFDNIAFGLKLKRIRKEIYDKDGNIKGYKYEGIDREEIASKVNKVASELELSDYLSRKPKQLSGGQKQRVALARALVRDNDIFLLDEPLSNLDAKLRVEMRKTIKYLHQNVKKPFIYVTHDQVEAMTLADKIVVLNKGKIQQIGTPKEIFDEPNNIFVATFFGSPSMSIISGKLIVKDDNLYVKLSNDDLIYISKDLEGQLLDYSLIDKDIKIGIRPSSFKSVLGEKKEHYSKINGEVISSELFGSETLVRFKISDDEILQAFVPNNFKIEKNISIYVHTNNVKLFNKDNGETIFGLSKESMLKSVPYKVLNEQLIIKTDKEYAFDIKNRLLINTNIGELDIKFDNTNTTLIKNDNSIKVSGSVAYIKQLLTKKAIFIKLKEQNEPIIVFDDLNSNIKINDIIDVYVPFDKLSFYKDNENILSKYEIDSLLFDSFLETKLYNKKEKFDKNLYTKELVKVLDVENYKDGCILYYKKKNSSNYLASKLENKIDMVLTPSLYLLFKNEK